MNEGQQSTGSFQMDPLKWSPSHEIKKPQETLASSIHEERLTGKSLPGKPDSSSHALGSVLAAFVSPGLLPGRPFCPLQQLPQTSDEVREMVDLLPQSVGMNVVQEDFQEVNPHTPGHLG